ncbi:hypothetical protein [Clostridium liquoris]|uniref:hypothetical protein n=1 Tax=Clostridium liquoris TaxID=1289519 RepID=UPI003119B59C
MGKRRDELKKLGHGKKGMGWVKDPKKAAYNKVYNKTTFGIILDIIGMILMTL